jgi:hypothetical protein
VGVVEAVGSGIGVAVGVGAAGARVGLTVAPGDGSVRSDAALVPSVKVRDALLPADPTASTLCPPAVPVGTVKENETLPVEEATRPVLSVIVEVELLYHLTVITSPLANPRRVALTVVPATPEAGDRPRLELTAKAVLTVLPLIRPLAIT